LPKSKFSRPQKIAPLRDHKLPQKKLVVTLSGFDWNLLLAELKKLAKLFLWFKDYPIEPEPESQELEIVPIQEAPDTPSLDNGEPDWEWVKIAV
jgi:hypothetical protein